MNITNSRFTIYSFGVTILMKKAFGTISAEVRTMKRSNDSMMFAFERMVHSFSHLYQEMALEFAPTRGMWMK